MTVRLTELGETSVLLGGRTVSGLDLLDSWAADAFRTFEESQITDRSQYAGASTMRDLYASLLTRDRLGQCVACVGGADGVSPAVESIDNRFRAATVEDPDRWMAQLARATGDDRWCRLEQWWWGRIPAAGPVAEEIARVKQQSQGRR